MVVGTSKQADQIPTKEKVNKKVKTVDVPKNYSFDQDMQNQILSNLYVKDGAAYSVYYFVKDSADIYIQSLNHLPLKSKELLKSIPY